jgi:hypothetical protein
MPSNQRDPGSNSVAGIPPITRAFGVTVLVALLGLIVLRHLFGSIRIEGGVK